MSSTIHKNLAEGTEVCSISPDMGYADYGIIPPHHTILAQVDLNQPGNWLQARAEDIVHDVSITQASFAERAGSVSVVEVHHERLHPSEVNCDGVLVRRGGLFYANRAVFTHHK
jgi:hypothetical protein